MAMGARIRMRINQLTLMQWLSPGFPVGAFAYSHGLEQAVARGDVTGAPAFADWLEDVLAHGSGRSDAILLHAAHQASTPEDLEALDELAQALAPSAERHLETTLQGAAFADATAAIWGTDTAPRAFPVALGAAARAQDIHATDAAAAYLHAFAANLTSAAIRLIPLGQTDGQAVLARLTPLCLEIAKTTATCSPDDIGTCCFAADIASMQHETLYSRQFRS